MLQAVHGDKVRPSFREATGLQALPGGADPMLTACPAPLAALTACRHFSLWHTLFDAHDIRQRIIQGEILGIRS